MRSESPITKGKRTGTRECKRNERGIEKANGTKEENTESTGKK